MKVGIIGAGQLARMMAMAAYPLGITCHCSANSTTDSAAGVSQLHTIDLCDDNNLKAFINNVDVITFENENVASTLLDKIALYAKQTQTAVYPNVKTIKIIQDRLLEKTTVNQLGIATTKFKAVNNLSELQQAINSVKLPCILKTRFLGYDGKGQYFIKTAQDAEKVWQLLMSAVDSPDEQHTCIVEQFVDFDYEVSMISTRGADGETVYYPLTRNTHRDGILRQSEAGIHLHSNLQQQAERYADELLTYFDYVGTLAIEFFVKSETLYVNELAPRVHNSGHWTIEGAATSQFENHIRAILRLPLGSTHTERPAIMLNCIGNMPPLNDILDLPDAHYHTYDKSPRPRRKLGHVTVVNPDKHVLIKLQQLVDG
ncbi:MAG: 5-(carboxyamino)imidazole ribonucleotide synthase [Pseudomonadota bacterium]